jgi:uncharacterized protein YjbI with pentapeptide repeats
MPNHEENMANDEQLKLLKKAILAKDIEIWNSWRLANLNIKPVNNTAKLRAMLLIMANIIDMSHMGSDLIGKSLTGPDLTMADLYGANISGINLMYADLRGAVLVGANLSGSYLSWANLGWANLSEANLSGVDLRWANLSRANFEKANLTGCRVYGLSAWDLKLADTIQDGLIITPFGEQPSITVDNLEMAQFIYLLLHNPKIRNVIDTIGKKAVLILGRFSRERKEILDALRDELRKQNYVPILFDFDKPTTRDLTETIVTLAHLSRFIIADITDPSSIPKELEAIVPTLAVPVQPLLAIGTHSYAMFVDNWKYDWVLKKYEYEGLDTLIQHLSDRVISPAEAKANELEKRRADSQ